MLLCWIVLLMKNLKLHETNKLFYGQYLFKLVFRNQLNVIFRSELQKPTKLSYARERLDELTESYRNNLPLTRKTFRTEIPIPLIDYYDAKELYTVLKNSNDYRIRIDPLSTISIFSNDKNWLLNIIAEKLNTTDIEFWEPNELYIDLLKSKTKIILTNRKHHLPYKVIFNGNRVPKDFANWINANRDKVRIGMVALEQLEEYGYLNGFYIYVRDEKVLNLVTLLVGSSVRSVEKLLYKGDIDK